MFVFFFFLLGRSHRKMSRPLNAQSISVSRLILVMVSLLWLATALPKQSPMAALSLSLLQLPASAITVFTR